MIALLAACVGCGGVELLYINNVQAVIQLIAGTITLIVCFTIYTNGGKEK